jgi:hypothetical protein
MAMPNPTRPWAIVLTHLAGTDPPAVSGLAVGDVGTYLRDLMTTGQFGGFSVGDFWHQQTLGLVSFAGTEIFDWAPAPWGLHDHPGSLRNMERHELRLP